MLALLAPALAVAAFKGLQAGDGPARTPSVLLVTIDTLRADHVGAYGASFAETPQLDALAQRGTRFAKAISPTPITLPSHTTLLTGLDPVRHGVHHNGIFRLDERFVTLAERFQSAGYRTGALVSSTMLARRHGLDQGFEHYDDDVSGGDPAAGRFQLDAGRITDKALAWLSHAPEPFFLWLHYYDPHASYRPPAPFAERFAQRPYDGEIAYTDQQLGRVLAALHAAGRSGHTLIAVTSDHGESLGEHGELSHSYSVYDATQWVPLLLAGPGVPAGRVVEGVVRLADVAPTLLALAGLEPPAQADGRDLEPLWEAGVGRAERIAYLETHATRIDQGWSAVHGLRTNDHLFLRVPRPELYRAESDPAQRHDLLADGMHPHARIVAALEAELDARLAGDGQDAGLELDAATRTALETLGYAVPSQPVAESGIDPKDGLPMLARYHEAERANHAGRLREGEAILRELLEAQPQSAMLHAALAATYLALAEEAPALVHARRAAALLPNSVEHLLLLARAESAAREPEAAVASAKRAEALAPDDVRVPLQLLSSELRAGRLARASAAARRARSLAPRDIGVARAIADAWEAAGRSEQALEAYRAALAIDPGSERDHMHVAVHLARLERFGEAEAHRARAGSVATDPRAARELAAAYREGGDRERARRLLLEMQKRHPEDATWQEELTRLKDRGAL